MSKLTSSIFWAIAIILFVLGIWPIGLIIVAILLANTLKSKSKPNVEELEKENQALKAEIQKLRQEKEHQESDEDFINRIVQNSTGESR